MTSPVAIVLVGAVLSTFPRGVARYQSRGGEPTLIECGQTATVPPVDEDLVTRVTTALEAAGWMVRPQPSSDIGNHRQLELTRAGATAFLFMTFMNTPGDAAQLLQCDRLLVQQPRSRPIAGLGDEAYVMSVAGLKVRVSNLVFDVNSRASSLEFERAVAAIVAAAAARGRAEDRSARHGRRLRLAGHFQALRLATSTTRPFTSSRSKARSRRKCYLCLRNSPSPM
jgi:hypothetical protein